MSDTDGYRDPELGWLVPFARWLRRYRVVGAFKSGMKWARKGGMYGYDAEQIAYELWPKDRDLRDAFQAGGRVERAP